MKFSQQQLELNKERQKPFSLPLMVNYHELNIYDRLRRIEYFGKLP